ncbi:phospho-N-acetylmuramoyl-pentapeptide-transferase [candidate division Kazan bacterium]|uniref:Phospho-N-acetylmuramoyl-pentapeptide-transferase n=1 Tax=candidate division Kazan bacterium TaxID=2202143 RepID=A0A420ZD79_UNCK3|nr:MAG: phospho-N-acetylmuramoyl-pentapeptide-transferase [candidate division Kazan bacterium]
MEEAILQANLLRIFMLAAMGFFVAILATPFWTNFLYKYKFWKKPKTETIDGREATVFGKLHAEKHKRNIPTMAGILFWAIVVILSLKFNLTRSQTYLPLFSLVSIGVIGAVDDWFNIRGIGGIKGIRARHKIAWLFAVAAVGAWWFFYKLGYDSFHIPAVGDFFVGWWFIPIFIFVILATANAFNITDGLDGLSGGLFAVAFGSYGILALAGNQISLAIFCATVVGVLLAYLWFNVFPARFFGGDTYALSFGATLGVVAMLIHNGVGVAVLPLIAFVPMMETISVILQLAYRKLYGKKLLLVAPIHHHFEAIGWPETKVTTRFWIIGAVLAVLGVVVGILGAG